MGGKAINGWYNTLMSTFLIGLFVAAGAGAWAYSKIQRRTGGNTQTSLMMAGIAAVLAFLFIVIVFSFIPD